MADLKSFAQPTNTTLYTDVVDTERGFHSAHATMVHNGYASPPVGAVNLDNAGGATRAFTQWNGTAYAGFALAAPAFQANNLNFNLANCAVRQDVGSGNPGFNFDANDFMDYDRTANRWRIAIAGVERLVVDATGTYTKQRTLIQFDTTAPVYNTGHLELRTDNGSDASMGFHRGGLTACQLRHSGNGLILSGTSRTDPADLLVLGKILQTGVTDDGVTALQTTSYSASNQSSLTGGSGNTSLIAPNAGAILDITTRTLKGGVTVGLGSTRITAPVAGLYLLSGSVGFFNGAVKGSAYIRINKNDVFVSFQGEANTVPNQGVGLQINLQIPLLANDFITIQVVNAPDAGGTNASATIRDISFTKIN